MNTATTLQSFLSTLMAACMLPASFIFFCGPAQAQLNVEFTRIAGEGDALGDGVFSQIISSGPAIGNDGVIAFEYNFGGFGNSEALFTNAGGTLNRVVQNGDITNSGLTITRPGIALVRDGFTSFRSITSGASGVFQAANTGGPITTIIDATTPVPGLPAESFTRFSNHSRFGNVSMVEAQRTGNGIDPGIYVNNNGDISTLIEVNGVSPLNSNRTVARGFFGNPFIGDTGYAFRFTDDADIRYLVADLGSGLEVIVDSTVAAPNGLGNFDVFADVSIDGDQLVFAGLTPSPTDGRGIYTVDLDTGEISVIADTTTAIPDGGGELFDFVRHPSISGGNVVFEGQAEQGFYELFGMFGGELTKLAGAGTILDGREVEQVLLLEREALEGNQFVFGVNFTDNTGAYYVGQVIPEPNSLALLALGALTLLRRRRT